MKFSSALNEAQLIKRYKRFLVDLVEADGAEFTVHCANTGKMTGCADPGFKAFYSTSKNTKRKYPHSLELTQNTLDHLICVNTNHANKVAIEALKMHQIPELLDYEIHQSEVKYGTENSRIDILLRDPNRTDCYIEVKSVTLLEQQQGYFPDTQTLRGQKHLRELIQMKLQGHRAVLLFMVMHTGIESVKPAAHIDHEYAKLLVKAKEMGVEIYAYNTMISLEEIKIKHRVPVLMA
ncbi:sugar fermentation stimulation protein SfsA [Pseudoalteromonas sp. MSK9-3]|uniref:DNA/RNA nuclease SfsA n=1 Tax=Pseudoalteromonas sp. MSK9-3 TaxID=1897633 RepID=UPI000E6C97E6|nr:DNA/RNA nuclease SfsA [Pseudoalteromonas sp. MSK9-3]RJE76639.1 sugar fermentation stimulation protein SfsA [Pseudoalteromonas sp. MSK9-3]